MPTTKRFGLPRTPEASEQASVQRRSATDDLIRDLDALKSLWTKSRMNRDRAAIYPFLEAVFELVTRSQRENRARYLERKVASLAPSIYRTQDPFMAVIHCVTPIRAVQSRTRSKWSRALAFAQRKKRADESLQTFILRRGGINECAARCRKRN